MGAVLRPVGPLPPAVYWRRRVVVVAALALVLVLAGRVMGASGATSGGGAGQGSSGSTVSSTASTHRATPASHPTSTAHQGTTATSTATPLCPDSAIRVSVASDALSYPAGVIPGLTISVTNTGSTPCARDVGSGALGLLITSGPDRIWSSDDCQKPGPAAVRTIAPGTSVSQSVAWTRHRSSKACPTGSPADAQPGTYVLTGHAGAVTSKPAVFRLG